MKRQTSFLNTSATLYLVATPIGNLSEFTPRAIEVLKEVDFIACEDTRNTKKLLTHFEIQGRLLAYHNFNEEESTKGLLELLKEGKNIALLSDAGYPLLSDPGYVIVNKAVEEDINVVTISGPNAGLNALVASGLDTRHFLFYGFLNAKESAMKKELEELKDFPYTLIFYEAPHRILKTLKILLEVLGNRKVVLARELTKKYEEFIRGDLKELVNLEELKGEMVLLIEGKSKEEEIDLATLVQEVDDYIAKGMRTKDAISTIAKQHQVSKNDLYDYYHKR